MGSPEILITGASGIVGSSLLQTLLAEGRAVRVLARDPGKFAEHRLLEIVEGDILDVPSLEESLRGIRQVYHCAGLVTFEPGQGRPLYATNVIGTANVVNAMLDIPECKLVHMSSTAALGRYTREQHIHEGATWQKSKLNSSYAVSKHLAEQEVWRGIAEGLNAAIVNPSVIIGRSGWQQSSGALLARVAKGQRFYPSAVNGFVDVDDVVAGMITLMESEISSERFILSGESLPIRDVMQWMAEDLEVRIPDRALPSWAMPLAAPADAIRATITFSRRRISRQLMRNMGSKYYYSNEKASQLLGLRFTPIRESVRLAVNAYRNSYPNEHRNR